MAERAAVVVLDVDDTIVDTITTGWQKLELVATSLGTGRIDRVVFDESYGTIDFEGTATRLFPSTPLHAVAAAYDALAATIPPMPIGAPASAIHTMRAAGVRVAIHTNGSAAKTARKLSALGIEPTDLDVVQTADDGVAPKPHSDAFGTLLDRLGARPDDVWFVSDEPREWSAARAAGMRTIGIASGRRSVHAPAALADVLLPSIDAAPAVVAALHSTRPLPLRAARDRSTVVSFDAGGTLIDHRDDPVQTVVAALAAVGVVVDHEVVRAAAQRSAPMLRDPAFWADERTATATLHAYYAAVLSSVAEVPDRLATTVVARYCGPDNWIPRSPGRHMVEVVREAGWRSAVLSNWPTGLEQCLRAAGFDAAALHPTMASTAIGAAKPAVGAFRALEDAAGAVRLHVGDSVAHDVLGAYGAGIPAFLAGDDDDGGRLCALLT